VWIDGAAEEAGSSGKVAFRRGCWSTSPPARTHSKYTGSLFWAEREMAAMRIDLDEEAQLISRIDPITGMN
jgi:hypothetical protein